LAAERAARERAAADFVTGSRKRSEEMAQFDAMLQETVAEIDRLSKTELPRLVSDVGTLDAAVGDGKIRYMNGRFAAGRTVLDKLADIARVATVEELRTFIVTACHLAGELADVLENDSSSNSPGLVVMNKSRNKSTCIPLRLAGLDLGFIWEDEDIEREYSATMKRAELDGAILRDIADLMIKNAESKDGFVSFGKDGDRNRRNNDYSSSKYDDDDYHRGYDDDEYTYEEDDDEGYRYSKEEEDEEKDSGDESAEQSATDEDVGAAGVETETDSAEVRKEAVLKTVSSTRLAASRSPFVFQARSLTDKIDAILKESESNDENDDEEGEGDEIPADADSDGEEQPAFDPQSVQMTRGALDRRLKHVEKGQSFATSAAVLLSALEQTSPGAALALDMFNLAVMTIYHSQLSSGDVADLFYLTMMGDDGPSSAAQDETCSSIYTALCPPAAPDMRLGVSLPPQTLVDAAEGRCKERVPTATTGCSSDSSDIPSNVSDGFSGYFIPKPLGDEDPLRSLFEPLSTLSSIVTEVSNLEEAKRESDSSLSKLRREIDVLEKKIGGRDEHKYGADGELYGIRDSCYAVESGKYEYEVCMFKKATQRDKGQKGGGTHLGNWAGMSRDEESGQRVMKWDKGTKCWNGPARSATVYVTCGAETKLLTADEPSTCEYVFTMESHIACDDDFKQEHGI